MSIGFGELLVIFCVAFFVVGPKDLPKVARTIARIVKKCKSMMENVTNEFEEELDLEETKKQVQGVNTELEKVQKQVNEHIDSLNQEKSI